jgi:hypothetical protein
VGALEVWFDPETGNIERSAAAGLRWKVVCEGEAVSILGDVGRGEAGLLGAGRWTGKGIADRRATGAPIADSAWGKLEHALRGAFATSAPGRGYAEAIVELTSGKLGHRQHAPTDRRAANAFEWKIVVEGDRVTVHARDEHGLARARWDGQGLVDREARSKRGGTVNDYQWGLVEDAAIELITGRAPPRRAAFSGVPAASAPPREERMGGRPAAPKDRRSGGWALAAAALALAGTIASWQVMPPGDGAALAATIALGLVTLGLVIYGGAGLATRCPRCKAWYRRETTSTEETGSSTYTQTIEQPVHDSSGKQIGTTSELATYRRTTYCYHYRCKECSHRWTGTGSSDERIG